MNPTDILAEYYKPGSKAFDILVAHGERVARKALAAAERVAHLKPDLEFIENAAMLHDIGILETDSPELGCNGRHPYVCHGILGRKMLESSGVPAYGPICERHIGVGISVQDVRQQNLPLPAHDMLPVSIEEQIVCYADKFFSKNGNGRRAEEKSVEKIIDGLQRYGPEKVKRFQRWVKMFEFE